MTKGTRKGTKRKDKLLVPKYKHTESIPAKSLDYIDTLHLSTNLEWHIPAKDWQKYEADSVTVDKLYEWQYEKLKPLLDSSKHLGSGNGYVWYGFENYRLGVCDWAKAKRGNQPNCVIQYEHSHLWLKGKMLEGLELPFSKDRKLYMIKRVDVTKTICLNVDYTVDHGFISPYRTDPLNPTRFKGTVYLGSRENGNVVRIYNKSRELIENSSGSKQDLYWKYFGGMPTIDSLYTFEHEMHRKYLRPVLGIDRFSELDKVWKSWSNVMGKIRIFKLTDKNRKLIRDGKRDQVPAKVLSPPTEYERPERLQYDPSYPMHLKRIKGEILSYMDRVHAKKIKGYSRGSYFAKLFSDILADLGSAEDLEAFPLELSEWLEGLEQSETIKEKNYEEIL